MTISRTRRSRVFTVSFPEDLARQVDQLARRESRNISELFREAFRIYRLGGIQRQLELARAAARSAAVPTDYREQDIERFVDEVRASEARKKRT